MRRAAFRGVTLTEILVVVSILAAIAALLTPVYVRGKESASQTNCMSNLRQLGLAIQIYRADYGGDGIYGNPDEMALPRLSSIECYRNFLGQTGIDVWKCRNQRSMHAGGRVPLTSYIRLYPGDPALSDWERFEADAHRYQDGTILFFDQNHMPNDSEFSHLYNKTAIGLRLDGTAKRKTNSGFHHSQAWWQD